MEVDAYVLITLKSAKIETCVREALKTLVSFKRVEKEEKAYVKKAEMVTGQYDIIAEVAGDDPKQIGELVAEIHGIGNIKSTVTCFKAA
ncbi:MAG: Lrp/AsnC ligand binding domain-containing protein [Patescibacteria group bacterium]|jgi:DNA-binding Lrp family transcriptional regulator